MQTSVPAPSLQAKSLLCYAGVSLLVATVGGAVGSHALTSLDARALASFETAVQFQFFHGLALLALPLVGLRGIGGRGLWLAAWLIAIGTLLFSGSIYAKTFGAPAGIVSAAPWGGVTIMLGWLLFAASVWRRA
ncbi:MAG TPA: DUF423 domain-containing protein [Gammaproteobacteria bacterium]|jgi:uncharacterized membrane protein YgdD (TMEM256/DUF423 family)|nr:DUF423 domain-containing protein [Gammaproteobacteria bacterium]